MQPADLDRDRISILIARTYSVSGRNGTQDISRPSDIVELTDDRASQCPGCFQALGLENDMPKAFLKQLDCFTT
jgi:hypothetical protein